MEVSPAGTTVVLSAAGTTVVVSPAGTTVAVTVLVGPTEAGVEVETVVTVIVLVPVTGIVTVEVPLVVVL